MKSVGFYPASAFDNNDLLTVYRQTSAELERVKMRNFWSDLFNRTSQEMHIRETMLRQSVSELRVELQRRGLLIT